MMLGIGQTAANTGTAVSTTAAPTFMQGVEVWASPSAGFSALQTIVSSPSTAFSSASLPNSLGVLAVPVGLIALIVAVSSKGGRR